MEEVYLTVKELAGLKNCTERAVQRNIERDSIEYLEVFGTSKGQGGIQYRIPFSTLDSKLKLKYKRLKKKEASILKVSELSEKDGLETKDDKNKDTFEEKTNLQDLSLEEREEIIFWKDLLKNWRLYRSQSESSLKEADENFIKMMEIKHEDLTINRRALYRKWKNYQEKGEISLVDKRGKHGKHLKSLDTKTWDIFEHFYLDESQKSVTLCIKLCELELKKTDKSLLPLASYDSFQREVNKISEPYIQYFRHGNMNFISNCAPYIKRMYEDLEPNDIWVADNHTFDVIVHDGTKNLRVYLTAFMDVRTRKMMGWCVTDRPSSDATIYALKKGIEDYGIPKMLYTDNGREFLFHDFGGNGFRRKRKENEELSTPTILKSLNIKFSTALPRNARAKGIERAFYTVKETFSKLFEAYTGGNVVEKPERLKDVVKKHENLVKVEKFSQFVDTYLKGWYNKQSHTGEGMNGLSPDEAFSKLLISQRKARLEDLELMFMRWSRPLKVGKNGVRLKIYEKNLDYFNKELWSQHFGKEVYIRYSPDNLNEIRVYDIDERFICMAELKEELGYKATKEEIARNQKELRSTIKTVSLYKKQKDIKTTNELKLILDAASENLEKGENINPKVIVPEFTKEKFLKVANFEEDIADAPNWTRALANEKRRRGEEDDR